MLVTREFLFVLARHMFDVAGVYRLLMLLVNKVSSGCRANKELVFFLFLPILTVLLDNASSALIVTAKKTLEKDNSMIGYKSELLKLVHPGYCLEKAYDHSNAQSPLLQELARAADSHNIKDKLLVLFEREVIEDRQNMQNYYRLSNKLNEAVRMRDGYINELQTSNDSNEVADSIKILKRMQIDDIQMASRLMVTAGEMQTKVIEKNNFIMLLKLD
ncbi:hypothetical protein Tco_0328335 [Tanacetum coccineum]